MFEGAPAACVEFSPLTQVPTQHCASCGGPVAAEDLRCRSCGSQLADLACPRCFAHAPRGTAHCPRCGAALAREAPAPAPSRCPACRGPLQARSVGATPVHDCPSCGGLWLERETFLHLVEDREERQPFLDQPAPAEAPGPLTAVRYRPCPSCGALMNRSNYARVSGVILDTCKPHGIWFDRDELGRVLRFIEQGGLQKAVAREKVDLQAERARLQDAARAAVRGDETWGPADLEAGLLGHLLLGSAWTLFDR